MWETIRGAVRHCSTVIFLVGAVLIATGYAASLKPRAPAFDELEYLAYARSLALAGVYAVTPEGPQRDAAPGREPAYPAVAAAAIHIDSRLRETLLTCWPLDPSCGQHVADLRYVNALLIALAAWLVFLTVRALGRGSLAAVVAGLYLLLNLQMNKTASHIISDYLALALAALFGLWLVKAASARTTAWWAAAGAALAALVLTKSIYILFAALLLAGLAAWGLVAWARRGARGLLPLLLVAVVLAGTAGAWYARNVSLYGTAHDTRGAIALSTREVFNEMSAAENAAAFLWWTRGFGEKMARRLLPESAWRRHELYAEDGFYLQGQVHRYEARVRDHMAEHGAGRRAAEAAMSGAIVRDMLARWPAYLAAMPALFYRGLWFDEFIVFGLPALAWLIGRAWGRRDRATLLALAAGVFSLLAYPALSLNIPRYQFTAAPALAIAAGIAMEALRQRWRSWREGKRVASPERQRTAGVVRSGNR